MWNKTHSKVHSPEEKRITGTIAIVSLFFVVLQGEVYNLKVLEVGWCGVSCELIISEGNWCLFLWCFEVNVFVGFVVISDGFGALLE